MSSPTAGKSCEGTHGPSQQLVPLAEDAGAKPCQVPCVPGEKPRRECASVQGAPVDPWVSAAAEPKVPEVGSRLVSESREPLGRESSHSLPTHPFQVPASCSHTVLADLAEATPCPLLEGTPDCPACRLSSSKRQPCLLEPWQPRGGGGEAARTPPPRCPRPAAVGPRTPPPTPCSGLALWLPPPRGHLLSIFTFETQL